MCLYKNPPTAPQHSTPPTIWTDSLSLLTWLNAVRKPASQPASQPVSRHIAKVSAKYFIFLSVHHQRCVHNICYTAEIMMTLPPIWCIVWERSVVGLAVPIAMVSWMWLIIYRFHLRMSGCLVCCLFFFFFDNSGTRLWFI